MSFPFCSEPSGNAIDLTKFMEACLEFVEEQDTRFLTWGPNMKPADIKWFGSRLSMLKLIRKTLDESMEQIEEDKKNLTDAQYLHFMYGAKIFNEAFFGYNTSFVDKQAWANRELIETMLDDLGVECKVNFVDRDSEEQGKQQKRTNNKKKKKNKRK